MRTKTGNRIKAEKSSGNIFADLGLPHPERELLKAKLTLEIYRLIRKRNLTQAEAGSILGIKQPHVSALMRNRAGSFSVERLMDFLAALGQDVEIRVKPAGERRGEVTSSHEKPISPSLGVPIWFVSTKGFTPTMCAKVRLFNTTHKCFRAD